jgi:hypothetical protein
MEEDRAVCRVNISLHRVVCPFRMPLVFARSEWIVISWPLTPFDGALSRTNVPA